MALSALLLYVTCSAVVVSFLLQEAAATRFQDVTSTASTGGGNCVGGWASGDGDTYYKGTSVAWGDYDGDGDQDVYLAYNDNGDSFSGYAENSLCENGDGTFTDVTITADIWTGSGTDNIGGTIGAWGDFNGASQLFADGTLFF